MFWSWVYFYFKGNLKGILVFGMGGSVFCFLIFFFLMSCFFFIVICLSSMLVGLLFVFWGIKLLWIVSLRISLCNFLMLYNLNLLLLFWFDVDFFLIVEV